jgi:cold shock CspA family protein
MNSFRKILAVNDWVDFYREKEKNAAKIICPAKAQRFQVTHFLRASLRLPI